MATESRESLHLQVDAGRTLVSRSPQLHRIWGVVQRVAPTDVSVLVTGETGTGKEIIGRLIHKLSPRAAREFVPVDCNAVAPSLLESELFGHERGAFTGADHRRAGVFELADGTTLFLDEVANLPLEAQAKMLRVLQEREFRRIGGQHLIRSDFRLITATNADLTSAVRVGSFREDLFHRLNVVHIHLPPLRERRQDIPLLMSYFIDQKRLRLKRPGVQRVSHQAVDLLMSYDWPGNVRELENVIHRSFALRGRLKLLPADLFDHSIDTPESSPTQAGQSVGEMERKLIMTTIEQTSGNRTHAAKLLGISLRTLRNKLREYRVEEAAAI